MVTTIKPLRWCLQAHSNTPLFKKFTCKKFSTLQKVCVVRANSGITYWLWCEKTIRRCWRYVATDEDVIFVVLTSDGLKYRWHFLCEGMWKCYNILKLKDAFISCIENVSRWKEPTGSCIKDIECLYQHTIIHCTLKTNTDCFRIGCDNI